MIDSGILIANLPAFARSAAARPRRSPIRRWVSRGWQRGLLALVLIAGICAACGKKGPPLAPLLKVPVAPPDVAARRTGDIATLQLRIPNSNSDNTRPANIERVEVYGFTGPAPTGPDIVKYGTLVASVPVRLAETQEEDSRSDGASAGARKPRPPASMENGFDQGDLVTVTEPLGAEQAKPVDVKRRGKQPPPTFRDEWHPELQPPTKDGSVRLYYAVGVNRKGQRGAFTAPQPVPLGPAPSAPSSLTVTYDAKGVMLSWVEPQDVPKPIQAAAAEGELASTLRAQRQTTGGYNVYEVPAPKAGVKADGPAPVRPIDTGLVSKPLNDKLLETPSFTDARVEFGKERCFLVRAVSQSGSEVTESGPSETACVTPVDTFPPEAPKGLAAVASEGAISLIWEASPDADLAGYFVMRAEGGGEPRSVTPEPIKETTFRDATASRGVRYTYTVVAVDTAGNRSAPSNAVEETAR